MMGVKKVVSGELDSIRKESLSKITTLIITAFGLVAALAWNSAIQSIFSKIFGSTTDMFALLGYAVFVTLIAVIVTIYLTRLTAKQQ
jgi:uncharacterized membrane protein (DUF106 family)